MKRLLSAVAVAATMAATSAAAVPVGTVATYDFGLLATGNEGTWSSRPTNANIAGGAFNTTTDTFTVNGIGVIATAYNSAGTDISQAYLDGLSGGKPAGLGVCSTVNASNQCGTGSDDNIGATGDMGSVFETVKLTFSQTVSITSLLLRDRGHDNLPTALIGINGSNFNFGTKALDTLAPASMFTFSRVADGVDFYVNTAVVTAVPVPLALPMALAAFGGMALMGRRRRAAAA